LFLIASTDTAGWPDPSCQFPDWLLDTTWHSFDGQWKYNINQDLTVLTIHEARSSKQNLGGLSLERSEFRCRQRVDRHGNEVIIYSMALHNW